MHNIHVNRVPLLFWEFQHRIRIYNERKKRQRPKYQGIAIFEGWSTRTDFDGVSRIGYQEDDGQVIKGIKLIAQYLYFLDQENING